MIDWTRLAALHQEMGAQEFATILELFLDEIEATVMRLPGCAPHLLEGPLHFLQGSASNIGMRQFEAACRACERLAAGGRADQVDVAALTECYAASKRTLVRELAQRLSCSCSDVAC